tara:strand:+ start:213 stop:518 length:306 start_codon:yes stop_codon:yes gene_type:complete
MVIQQKTQSSVEFEITAQTCAALSNWIDHAELPYDNFLFKSRANTSKHITSRQYSRIVKSWLCEIGLDPAVCGTHSLRRTKAKLIYRRTKNLRAVQLLLAR